MKRSLVPLGRFRRRSRRERCAINILSGGLALLRGVKMLLLEPSLRSVLWRMLGLLALTMLLVSGGVFWLADSLAQQWVPVGDAWYWQLLGWLAWLVALLLSMFAGAIAYVTLGSAAVAPWLELLAERVAELRGEELPACPLGWLGICGQSLANALRPLLSLMVAGVIALLLWWIPVVGQVAATIIWGFASLRYLCLSLMDTQASRAGLDYGERLAEWRAHRGFWLAFGGVAMVVLMVPLLNLLLLPAAVVGLAGSAFAQS
ncbi:MAG: EI24 domain-containing protein [Mariprofundales bacterium]|nr:EI24 domain-containing protein [Mariprofundales bacterium]